MSDELNHSMGLTNPPNSKPYALRGKIMVSTIIILFFVVIVMVSLHLYARWYLLRARRRQLLRRRSRLNHATRRTTQQQIVFYVDNSNPANRGLEPAVFNSLPEFIYSSKTHHPEVSDCAVCLSEFEENETGRILPKCKHCFHVECIDMWFHSHSTCPLCRAPVEKFSDDNCSDSNSDHVVIDLGDPEPSRTDPDGETGTCSLGERRKEMRIEIPRTSELENHELRLSSPGVSQEFRSPGNRLLSFKRLLSMGKKTPTTPTPPVGSTTMPCGAAGTSSDFGSNRERVFSPHMHDITQPAEHTVCQHVQNIS